jgi:hypothetical protein
VGVAPNRVSAGVHVESTATQILKILKLVAATLPVACVPRTVHRELPRKAVRESVPKAWDVPGRELNAVVHTKLINSGRNRAEVRVVVIAAGDTRHRRGVVSAN